MSFNFLSEEEDLHKLIRDLQFQNEIQSSEIDQLKRKQECQEVQIQNLTSNQTPTRKTNSVKVLVEKFAENFAGHGIPHLFASDQTTRGFYAWLTFIIASSIFCGYYMASSLALYFSYDVFSSIKFKHHQEMNFPAFVVCSWASSYPLDKHIIYCSFEGQSCDLYGGFQKMRIIGEGDSLEHYCVRFSGGIMRNSGLKVAFLVTSDVI